MKLLGYGFMKSNRSRIWAARKFSKRIISLVRPKFLRGHKEEQEDEVIN